MSNVSLIDGHIDNAEHCVCCGAVIPEGRQVCIICGKKVNGKQRQIDRIRNMNVEELAKFLDYSVWEDENYHTVIDKKVLYNLEEVKQYLESEVTE